jgi:hypothetical protein
MNLDHEMKINSKKSDNKNHDLFSTNFMLKVEIKKNYNSQKNLILNNKI